MLWVLKPIDDSDFVLVTDVCDVALACVHIDAFMTGVEDDNADESIYDQLYEGNSVEVELRRVEVEREA
jgi:hypothetical protein